MTVVAVVVAVKATTATMFIRDVTQQKTFASECLGSSIFDLYFFI